MEMMIDCSVCGKTKFHQKCDYEICSYCGWENGDSDMVYHPNGDLSIADYRLRYEMYLHANPEYVWEKHGFPELTAKEKCEYWYQFSMSNKKEIERSEKCGCFFCIKIFDQFQISEHYINDKGGQTATCPYCGVDSVLPDSKVRLSVPFLEEMYKIYFEYDEG